MTKISFFNGLKEIGGTFVAIETESTKCMFDFGFCSCRTHGRKNP